MTKQTVETKRPRGRPKTLTPEQLSQLGRPRKTAATVESLRLRDQLEQLDADSPPVVDAPALLEAQTRRGPQILGMIQRGEVVVISRGILRAIIAELRAK